jgi:tetratricopeptide (TPR) repeat protein
LFIKQLKVDSGFALPTFRLTPYIFGLMKFGTAIRTGVAALALISAPLPTVGQDDKYVEIYSQIEEADQLVKAGQTDRARERYEQAQAELKRLQTGYPAWNTRAVQFRMDYITAKLGALPKGATNKPALKSPDTKAGAGKAGTTPKNNQEEQVGLLQQEIARLQGDNALLQGKLKEALQAQPAAVDPRQLEEAENKIRQLEKEKDLLKVDLEKAEAKQPDAVALGTVQQELEETKKKLSQSIAAIAALSQEKQQLEAEKNKLQGEAAKPPAGNPVNSELQKRIELLENERNNWQKEKEALQKQLKEAAAPASAPAPEVDSSAVEKAQKERDELLVKLNAAHKELFELKDKSKEPEAEGLKQQLAAARARLEAFEARKVPFTSEELAMFKPTELQPEPQAAPVVKKAPKELPPGAAKLLTEAQRAFAAKRYAEAEQKYQEVLKMDESNAATLANLGAIQLEQEKFAEAEATLKKALSIDPEDPYALSLSGILNFRQEKYDPALDYLSRAAQIDPKNAETQNYLGITLSQKGQREAAEAALRKAIQLAPEYAGAHHNLAVVYATQQPPFMQLAKYHYQKALKGGHPVNEELEKMINARTK